MSDSIFFYCGRTAANNPNKPYIVGKIFGRRIWWDRKNFILGHVTGVWRHKPFFEDFRIFWGKGHPILVIFEEKNPNFLAQYRPINYPSSNHRAPKLILRCWGDKNFWSWPSFSSMFDYVGVNWEIPYDINAVYFFLWPNGCEWPQQTIYRWKDIRKADIMRYKKFHFESRDGRMTS